MSEISARMDYDPAGRPRSAEDPESPQLPAINVYETDEHLVVVAAMPGVMAEDIDVHIEGEILDIAADLRSAAPKDYLIREWDYGAFARTIPLPVPAGAPATATYGNGQLIISLTKGVLSEEADIDVH